MQAYLLSSYTPKPAVSADDFVVILTPQLYNYKHESLKLRFAFQAKKIAPSLFVGLLDDEHEHDYSVHRADSGWHFFAYDPKAIRSMLQEKGIPINRVKKILFAQQLADKFSDGIEVGSGWQLKTIGDQVTFMPIDETDPPKGDLGTLLKRLPSGSIRLVDTKSTLLPRKGALLVAALFIIGALLYLIEALSYSRSLKEVSAPTVDDPKLKSAYVRKNILQKLQKLEESERPKRETIMKLSNLTIKGVELLSLELNSGKIVASFVAKQDDAKQKWLQLATSLGFKPTINGNEMKVEVSL